MVEYSEEVKKLAETLKSSGLAASTEDALERAQSMVGKKDVKEEVTEEKEEPFEQPTDAEQTTLDDVKVKEASDVAGESTEPKKELENEEVFTNKSDTEPKADEEPKKTGVDPSIAPNSSKKSQTKQEKIDLTDVFNVNKS